MAHKQLLETHLVCNLLENIWQTWKMQSQMGGQDYLLLYRRKVSYDFD